PPPSHLQVCRNLYRLFRFEEAPKLLWLPPEPPAANKSLLPPAPAASEHRSLVLPGSAAANANTLGLNPDTPGDQLYRFEALEIKELSLPRFQGQCLESCSGVLASYTGKTF
ncbi:hypothetical protein C7K08_14420, partial [Synechococcus lacustris str. Tous]